MDPAFVARRVGSMGSLHFRVAPGVRLSLTVHAIGGAPPRVGETTVSTSAGYCVLELARWSVPALRDVSVRLATAVEQMAAVAHLLDWDDRNTAPFPSASTAALCRELVDRWVAWLSGRAIGQQPRCG